MAYGKGESSGSGSEQIKSSTRASRRQLPRMNQDYEDIPF